MPAQDAPAGGTPAGGSAPAVSRRALLRAGAAGAALGALGGGAAAAAVARATAADDGGALPAGAAAEGAAGTAADAGRVAFAGANQAGVATAQQARAVFAAFTLHPGADAAALGRLLRAWSASAEALVAGRAAPGYGQGELTSAPSRLTVTVGLGAAALHLAGVSPAAVGLDPVPAFATDRLDPAWSGGDLLVQVCADDAVAVAHAVRVLARDAAPFAGPRWQQRGFLGAGSAPGTTAAHPGGRNLMGQVEGTGNPVPGTGTFARTAWAAGAFPPWWRGGTTLVLRRIRMDLTAWDRLDRTAQERAIGRTLGTGAPVGVDDPAGAPDFALTVVLPSERHVHADGTVEVHRDVEVLAIAPDAHVRRAHPAFNASTTMVRRGYSYDDGLLAASPAGAAAGGTPDVGLLFAAYAARTAAFTTVQRSLAAKDALNTWTTHVGSAAFAVPPGAAEGGWVGQTLPGLAG